MIYQPRNVTPSNISIDARIIEQYFTMEINTNDKVVAYQLTILNWDNTERYIGSKVNLDKPLFNGETLYILAPHDPNIINGNDYKWKVKLYQSNFDMEITKGIIQSVAGNTTIILQKNINIKEGMRLNCNGESRDITSYNINSGTATISSAFSTTPVAGGRYSIESNFIETVPEFVLYCREYPEVRITNVPEVLNKRTYTFTGIYNQADNVPMAYHRWEVYLPRDNGAFEVVDSTGEVYNSNLTYTYDAFKPNTTYVINLMVETNYGEMAYSELYEFTVQYDTIDYFEKPNAKIDYDKNAIQIDWVSPTHFSPKVINNNMYSGEIQPGVMGKNSFYIDKNLNIKAGDFIYFNHVELQIVSYNPTSGLVTVLEDLPESLAIGSSYYIAGITDIPVGAAVTLYRGVPYSGVNSVNTNQYSLIYENDDTDEGIGIYPDEYNLTMQFKPDEKFFYGATGVFSDLNLIGTIESTEDDGITGLILLFVHIYKMGVIYPEEENGKAIVYTFPTPPSGDTNTESYAYLSDDIDLDKTSYIYFPQYNYVENISSFDSATKKATFNKDLPFIPEQGDSYVMMNTITQNFYENPQNAWALQSTAYAQEDLDYRWIDSGNNWDDTKYWVEGGTAIVRIAQSWWKIQATKESIRIEKGGN